jgi:acylphosphatase
VTAGEERCEVYYSGWVQGVGFRWTARHLAQDHRVTGFVRNLADGRVELVVEGPSPQINSLLAAIDQQMGRHIDNASQSRGPATGEFRTFEVRH